MSEQQIIAGAGGGKSGGSGGGLSEEPDNLKSTAYAQVLDLVCEGEIGGLVNGLKSIYLDDVVVQNADGTSNFSNIIYTETTGTQSQGVITGFDQVRNEISVGVEAKVSSGPVVRTITNTNVTSIIVTVQVPTLTKLSSSGNLGGSSVNIAVDIQNNGGGWITKVNSTITGKSASSYQRQYRINLPAGGPWDVRLRRITDDSTSTKLNNKTVFFSYTEVIDAKLSYPNSALIAMKVDATQFRAIPKRGYDMKLLKIRIPKNATVQSDGSLVYSGTWDGTFQVAWCACPAWAYYDLLTTNRYGLGNYVNASQIDKWALYTISKYCNELVSNGFGGTEPRFTCNVWVNTRQDAFKLLNDFTSCFRGLAYWGSGAVTAVQDAPKDPTYLFTNANVIDGMFTYQGSSAKVRHTVALVTWNDPTDMYRQKVEYVEDATGIARYGIIETEVFAFGCTSRGQAARVGRWLLYSERYETEVVTFKTGTEGSICRPGDIIKVADQYRAGSRIGGRISSATSSSIVVDAAPSAVAAGDTLYVISPDGLSQQRTVASVSGTTLTVSAAFASVPAAQSAWIVSSNSISAQTFRVVSVTETDSGEHEIVGLEYNDSKFGYVENNLSLEQRTISNLSPVPDNLASVTLSESLYTYQASVLSKITATWPASKNATAYKVEWKVEGSNFQSDVTSAQDYDILNTNVAPYEVRVTPIGVFGTPAAAYTSATISALGKTAAPADVTGFAAVIDSLIGVTLNWTSVADLDLDQYEIRQGASWAAGTIITRVKANTYKIGTINGTTQTYWIKAVDTTGNYSVNATSVSTTLSAPSSVSPTAQVVDNNVLLKWTAATSTLAVDFYEIRRGSTWAGGTVVGRVSNATFATLFETSAGTYSYWIAGVDIGGNYGTPTSVVASVNQPPDYQLFLNYPSTFSGTKSNAIVSNGSLFIAVDTTETVQSHFTTRSWATPQAQISGGYPYFIQPTGTTGYYEEVIDYGSTLPSAKVSLIGNYTTPFGSSTVTPKISVSNTSSTGPWTDYSGVTEVYATTFRYIKIRYDVTAAGGDDIVQFTSINIKLDVKQKDDYGSIAANSADAGGTTVTFSQTFNSVTSITVTPQGTGARYAIYDFAGTPNPTTFKVLLFDSAGNRLSGTVSWTARGY